MSLLKQQMPCAPEASEEHAPAAAVSWLKALRKETVLLLGPLLLLSVFLIVRNATGEYFLSSNFDPDYVYLLNGLNLAISLPPVHTDHPGTTVQLLGALIIRLQNLGSSSVSTAVSTISNSEAYLGEINLVIFLLVFCSLVAGTFLIFRITRNKWPVLFFQSALAFLGANIYCLARTNPEPLLAGISILLGLSIYLEVTNHEKDTWTFVCISAFLCATGLATKLTFLPLILIPLLILRGWAKRGVYVGAMLAILSLWLVPILPSLRRVWDRIVRLLVHTGNYGKGPVGVVDLHSYLQGIIHIAADNYPFLLLVGASFFIAGYLLWSNRFTQGNQNTRILRVLLVVALCELLQVAMVCKYQESRYLIPSVTLAGLNLVFLYHLCGFSRWRAHFLVAWVALMIAGSSQSALALRTLSNRGAQNRAVFQHVEQTYRGNTKIFRYGASSPYYALYFANEFTCNVYGKLLEQMYPETTNVFFFNNFLGSYHTYSERVDRLAILRRSDSIIFQTPPFIDDDPIYCRPAGLKLEEKFGGVHEMIYEVSR